MLDKVAATVLASDPSSDLPISFDDVSFAAGPLLILDRVTLTLKPGPPTILLGPNGAGKTTLLRPASIRRRQNQPGTARSARAWGPP